LFFPEGTRSKDKVMAGFKKGAFSVAVKAGVPVVPITLVGTGRWHWGDRIVTGVIG
jgi:1-acyl-sn-glycerol-3-phosphate acyltransferase